MDLDQIFFFFQAEDGIRDLVRSRGLGDVYKRQVQRGHKGHRADQHAHRVRVVTKGAEEVGHVLMQELSLIHI